MNKFDEMREAMSEADGTMKAGDNVADQMARMLCGRLRRVPVFVLVTLKRELTSFDAHRKTWKS